MPWPGPAGAAGPKTACRAADRLGHELDSSSTSSTSSSGSLMPCARASRSRCSTTLRSGKKSRSSITVATSRRISGEVSASIAADLHRAVVRAIRTNQAAHNVDFPAPLRPVSAIASPVRTSRLNRSKIVLGPKARRSPKTFRMVVRLATWAFCPLRQAGPTALLNSDRPIQPQVRRNGVRAFPGRAATACSDSMERRRPVQLRRRALGAH